MTASEKIITALNTNVFYKEFTFSNNEFFPTPGAKKELADSVVLLDEIMFIIQIKERNPDNVVSSIPDTGWFSRVVLNKAKNQIKSSLEYLQTISDIQIENEMGVKVSVTEKHLQKAHKIIIYHLNGAQLSPDHLLLKFYESRDIGFIHLFQLEEYALICKYLLTPAELDEYLSFRIQLYSTHKLELNKLSEDYVLAHFLNTGDVAILNLTYLDALRTFKSEEAKFDISKFIHNFSKHLVNQEDLERQDYYHFIREIAKLKRYELAAFKKRFLTIIDYANQNIHSLPYRFTNERTGCGFVFIPLTKEYQAHWENALYNFTEIYKYARRTEKCIGLVCYKLDGYLYLSWCYIEHPWAYDAVLDHAEQEQEEMFTESKIEVLPRYMI